MLGTGPSVLCQTLGTDIPFQQTRRLRHGKEVHGPRSAGTRGQQGTNAIRATLAPDASRPRWESSRAAKDSAARSFHHAPSPARVKCPCTSSAWCLEYLRKQEAHCALCPWTHRLDCSSIPIPAHWLRREATITAVHQQREGAQGTTFCPFWHPAQACAAGSKGPQDRVRKGCCL